MCYTESIPRYTKYDLSFLRISFRRKFIAVNAAPTVNITVMTDSVEYSERRNSFRAIEVRSIFYYTERRKGMKRKALQWHPAFQAALQVELMEDREFLVFQEEHNLSKKPLQMDTLIIKQRKDYVVRKSIGKLFRQYNIIEYKSPEDYISVNDFYKVTGYACVYQSDTRKVLEIPPEELTITLVCSHFPRELVQHLKKRYQAVVWEEFQGIYYVKGLMFPMQILVTNRLSREEYIWLGRLRGGLEVTEIEPLAREYKSNQEDPLYQAVMDLIIRANAEQYEEVRKMCDALRELFADELEKREERGIELGIERGIECGIEQGREQGILLNLVSLVRKKQKKGMAVEEIAEILEADLQLVQKMYHVLELHPEHTDTEIVELLKM